jgi:V/A-type H+-transporting ATPase subunit D
MVRVEVVNPTRRQLFILKERMGLARMGYIILNEKLDFLMNEFHKLSKETSASRKEVNETLAEAFDALIKSEFIVGSKTMESIAKGMESYSDVEFSSKSMMGVTLIKLLQKKSEKNLVERGYNLLEGCASSDQAILSFQESFDRILKVGEYEHNLRTIAKEAYETRKVVMLLKNFIIPQLLSSIKYVKFRLEEQEREEFMRFKRVLSGTNFKESN